VKRIPQCYSVHPTRGTRCWGKYGHDYDCWAMVPVENSDRGIRITWRYNAPRQ